MIGQGVTAADVRNQVDNSKSKYFLFAIGRYTSDAATYETIYKTTLDFTYIDYLRLNFSINANGAIVQLDIDGSTEQTSGTTAGFYAYTIDCTSKTGDLTLTLKMKDDGGGGTNRTINDISLYNSEV